MRKAIVIALMSTTTALSAQTVANDGSAVYAYGFNLPPARERYQPSLALIYSSSGGVSPYGTGWSLTENYIDLSTRATPDGSGLARQRYTLVRGGVRHILVRLTNSAFRPDVADGYFVLNYNAANSTWTATDGLGNSYTYSCVTGTPSCNRWYLTRVQDVDNNTCVYEYSQSATQQCSSQSGSVPPTAALLTAIKYNFAAGAFSATAVHQVALGYSPTSSAQREVVDGCLVTYDQLLTSVTVTRTQRDGSFKTLGSWGLSYTLSSDTSRPLLTSIQPMDRNGTALGLATSFGYETDQASPSTVTPFADTPSIALGHMSNPLTMPTGSQCSAWLKGGRTLPTMCEVQDLAAWIDMDGDGLPDLVWGGQDVGSTPPQPGIRWARNLTRPTGSGTVTFDDVQIMPGSEGWPGALSFLSVDGSTITELWTPPRQLTNTLVVDVNGDGFPDLVTGGGAVGNDCPVAGTSSTNPNPYISIRFSQIDPATARRGFAAPVCANADPVIREYQQLYEPTGAYLPLTYTIDRLDDVNHVTYWSTWVHLVDVTGDGLLDFVVVNGPVGGGWAFSSAYVTLHPGTPSPMGGFPIREVTSVTESDMKDVNGDGLADRISRVKWVTADGVLAYRWDVDYNLGWDFAPGFVVEPRAPGYGPISDQDSMFIDVNRDGRPDYVTRSTRCPKRPTSQRNASESFEIFFNTGTGFTSDPNVTLWVQGACLMEPVEYDVSFREFRPYGTIDMGGTDPANETLVDVDGDGILDYVRGATHVEHAPGTWSFFRGQHQTRRSDILTSVAGATGAVTRLNWAPSSNYAVLPGLRSVSDVVASATVSGPAIDPLTTTYVYANPAVTKVWDDPSGSVNEPLGFLDRYEIPSLGGLVQHTRFGGVHFTSGVPVFTERGVLTSGTNGTAVPSYSSYLSDTRSLQARPVVSGICSSSPSPADYPVHRFVASGQRGQVESGITLASTVTNDCPDVWGNINKTTYVADTLSSTAVIVTRIYPPPTSTAQCVACLLEEYATESGSTDDLMRRYFHYDVTSIQAGHTTSSLLTGHLAYVEMLMSGSGVSGQYETPYFTAYNPNGTVQNVQKTYVGQAISALTTSYQYDTFSGLERTSETITDGTASLVTQYQWSAYGDLIEIDGPRLQTATTFPVLAWAYDSAGRAIAVARAPIIGNSVTKPLRAYEYVLPTLQSPAAVKTYSFSWGAGNPISYLIPAIPATDDVTQTIEYVDAFGRSVQSRTRLGTGTAATSGNIVRSLPQQYLVARNILLDALGRPVALLDPYFSSTGNYVDPRTRTDLGAGLHATTFGYDAKSRTVCSIYAPVSNGAIVSAPGDPAACLSNFSEDVNYRRASSIRYGVDSTLDGRPYFTVDATPDWASASPAFRTYTDAAGRTTYRRSPAGVHEQLLYDAQSNLTAVIRYRGVPGGAGAPSIRSSWSYDRRGRIVQEFADASGTKFYTYLSTGELVRVIQNATATTADTNAVWITQTIGSLGRVNQRDVNRWVQTGACAWQVATDSTTFQYDTPFPGQEPNRYGSSDILGGRLTAAMGAAATVAFGYDPNGVPVLRDEFTEPGTRNSVSESFGADGRLLQRTLGSPYLASAVTYTLGYDSVGHLIQVAGAAGVTYWMAGTGSGSTDAVTGPYDPLGRLVQERWDSGAAAMTRAFLAGSNLPASYSATVQPAGATSATAVYSYQGASWRGSLLGGYTVNSSVEGAGTAYAAAHDIDGHVASYSAAALGASGSATQQFNESYRLSLENFQSISRTNNLGLTSTATYLYEDPTSKERVTSIALPSAATNDYFDYDRRGRGLIMGHRISTTQNPPQDGYEYDGEGRLTSISRLGTKIEALSYGPYDDLISRQLTAAGETRYYVGDDLTLVRRGTVTIAYAHVRLGGFRIASVWSKSSGTTSTSGTIYYHRNQQGSVVATSTAGGQIAISYRYLPSGAIDMVVGTELDENASELGYIGGLKLSGGLVHLRARVYSPALRRFLQPDAAGLRRYTYAHGDPLNFVDRNGRFEDSLDPGGPIAQVCNPSCEGESGVKQFSPEGILEFLWSAIKGAWDAISNPSLPIVANNVPVAPAGLGGGSGGTGSGAAAAVGITTTRAPTSSGIGSGSGVGSGAGFVATSGDTGTGIGGIGKWIATASANDAQSAFPRLPDYVGVNINVAVQNPYTATLVGWSGTASIDRHGEIFWSPLGISVGKSATVFAFSVTANWLNQRAKPSREQLHDFLTAHGVNATLGYWAGVSESWTPGRGTATGIGFVTPQAGVSYNYSWFLYDTGWSW